MSNDSVHSPSTTRWNHITIATATTARTYYLLGDQLARILERLPGEPIEHVEAVQSNGSRENIQRLVDSAADMAFAMRPALAEAIRSKKLSSEEVIKAHLERIER